MPTTMATSTEAPAGIASEAAVPAEPSPESNNAFSPPYAAEEGTAQEVDVVSATVDVPTADTNADTNICLRLVFCCIVFIL
jgi:hypothetical protein